MRDTLRKLIEEARALCPVHRRRPHLLLLQRLGTMPVCVVGIVRPEDAAALRPLAQRLRENLPEAELRIAEAEDGQIDRVVLWVRAVPADRFLAEHQAEVPHAR